MQKKSKYTVNFTLIDESNGLMNIKHPQTNYWNKMKTCGTNKIRIHKYVKYKDFFEDVFLNLFSLKGDIKM